MKKQQHEIMEKYDKTYLSRLDTVSYQLGKVIRYKVDILNIIKYNKFSDVLSAWSLKTNKCLDEGEKGVPLDIFVTMFAKPVGYHSRRSVKHIISTNMVADSVHNVEAV